VIKERRLSKAPLLFNTLRKLALVQHEFACVKTRFGGITPDVTDAVCKVPRITNQPIKIVTLPKIALRPINGLMPRAVNHFQLRIILSRGQAAFSTNTAWT